MKGARVVAMAAKSPNAIIASKKPVEPPPLQNRIEQSRDVHEGTVCI